MHMTPIRPYLFRAFYDWLCDNHCTPYVVISVDHPGVAVPIEYAKDGRIILNISSSAVREFYVDNNELSFMARFDGRIFNVYAPMSAIMALYAEESGQGVVFTGQEFTHLEGGAALYNVSDLQLSHEELAPKKISKKPQHKKPHLTVVKCGPEDEN